LKSIPRYVIFGNVPYDVSCIHSDGEDILDLEATKQAVKSGVPAPIDMSSGVRTNDGLIPTAYFGYLTVTCYVYWLHGFRVSSTHNTYVSLETLFQCGSAPSPSPLVTLNSSFATFRQLRFQTSPAHVMRKLFKRKGSAKEKGKANADVSAAPPLGDGTVQLDGTFGELSVSDSHDREETKQRFAKASQALEEALKAWRSWKYAESGVIEFPELVGEPERFDDEFRNKLEKIMDTRKESLADKSLWVKSGDTIVAIFTAFSPFAKNFLSVAIHAQSVRLLLMDCLN